MNALIRKEARLLLPSFVIGLLLTLLIWLVPGEPAASYGFRASVVMLMFIVSPAILLTMTLSSFGREVSAGTFSLLLAQPVSRSRVWWTKALLLAAAVSLLWAAWWFSLSHNMNFLAQGREDRRDAFLMAALFVVAAYSGGLWTTLLFRQVAAAFWFTLLIPAALAMAVVALLHKREEAIDPALAPALVIVFSLYGLAGFLFARWLFLRAQDAHWTGGEIALPEVRGLAGRYGRRGDQRQRRPRSALRAKELQLQQPQFVVAGLLALMHLAVLATRKFGGSFKDSPALEFVLEQFWVLWLAMPLLVGCAAVADERKLGTLEGQLCLPSRRRTQFRIKFASALLLSVLLGVTVPLLFEGARILPEFSDSSGNNPPNYAITTPGGTIIPIGGIVAAIRAVLPYLTLVGIAVSIGLVSFYASSLSRNTMQALAPALLGILVAWFLFFAAAAPGEVFRYPLWNGGLIYLLGLPVMLFVLVGLMHWNFKRLLVGWNVWRRNTLVLLATLVGIGTLTSATYHRVWEHFMTLEPPHGAARLSRPAAFQCGGTKLSVQFPDGRNWGSQLALSVPHWPAMLTGDWKLTEEPGTTGYLDGKNWVSVDRNYRDVIGIQKDGSLWVSERPAKLSTLGLPASPPNPVMIQLGQDSDWKAVTVSGSLAFLLKTNGTLWGLGTNRSNWKDWTGFRAFVPERLAADSDWAGIRRMEFGRLAFQKTDGRVWVFPSLTQVISDHADLIQLSANTVLDRAPYFDGQISMASTWVSGPPGRNFRLGVGEDGVLRVIAYWGLVSKAGGRQQHYGFVPENISLGGETNWLALADNRYDIVGLRADGSLWKLGFTADPITEPEGFTATPLSRHKDWVALTGAMDGMIALAADGSLWFWAMEGRNHYASGFTLQPLLAASRRPQLIGSLFSSSTP
jgi:ABC-type transport system involved in multi-copper enzyme maturation permease subunit